MGGTSCASMAGLTDVLRHAEVVKRAGVLAFGSEDLCRRW